MHAGLRTIGGPLRCYSTQAAGAPAWRRKSDRSRARGGTTRCPPRVSGGQQHLAEAVEGIGGVGIDQRVNPQDGHRLGDRAVAQESIPERVDLGFEAPVAVGRGPLGRAKRPFGTGGVPPRHRRRDRVGDGGAGLPCHDGGHRRILSAAVLPGAERCVHGRRHEGTAVELVRRLVEDSGDLDREVTVGQHQRAVVAVLARLLAGGFAHERGLGPRLEEVGELLTRREGAAADDHEEPIRLVEPGPPEDLLHRIPVESAIAAEVLPDVEDGPRRLERIRQGEELVPLAAIGRGIGRGHHAAERGVERA